MVIRRIGDVATMIVNRLNVLIEVILVHKVNHVLVGRVFRSDMLTILEVIVLIDSVVPSSLLVLGCVIILVWRVLMADMMSSRDAIFTKLMVHRLMNCVMNWLKVVHWLGVVSTIVVIILMRLLVIGVVDITSVSDTIAHGLFFLRLRRALVNFIEGFVLDWWEMHGMINGGPLSVRL